jgi:hypothetical protein
MARICGDPPSRSAVGDQKASSIKDEVQMPETDQPNWQAFDSIRVIVDVHGDAIAYRTALVEAHARNLFVVQLGDLVDRGPDSAGALGEVEELRQ